MNLKVITNLAKLCELCTTQEAFYLDSKFNRYIFEQGELMLVLSNGDFIETSFKFNDIIKMTIISKNDD